MNASRSSGDRRVISSRVNFDVTQLSYTFRARRRPRQLAGKRETYHHRLKALAIPEHKIYIVGNADLKVEGTPVYLDVEALPDRDFYYLSGLRFQSGQRVSQHSLWAVNEMRSVSGEFLGILSRINKPVLIHYGSFETTFLKRMCGKYGEVGGSRPAEAITSCDTLDKCIGSAWLKVQEDLDFIRYPH
jgi:hypothetical protein